MNDFAAIEINLPRVNTLARDKTEQLYYRLILFPHFFIVEHASNGIEYPYTDPFDSESEHAIARTKGREVYRTGKWKHKSEIITEIGKFYVPDGDYWCIHLNCMGADVVTLYFNTDEEAELIYNKLDNYFFDMGKFIQNLQSSEECT